MRTNMVDSFGIISTDKRGLPCRAPAACSFISRVTDDLMPTLQAAILVRNAHELEAHQYVHPIKVERAWGGYGQNAQVHSGRVRKAVR